MVARHWDLRAAKSDAASLSRSQWGDIVYLTKVLDEKLAEKPGIDCSETYYNVGTIAPNDGKILGAWMYGQHVISGNRKSVAPRCAGFQIDTRPKNCR